MDEQSDETLTHKKNFNEERINAWRAQRLEFAENASKERKEKAEKDKELRIERAKIQRQEELHSIEQEKKAKALNKLASDEKLNELRQTFALEEQNKTRFVFKKFLFFILASALLSLLICCFKTPFYEAESVVTIKTNSSNDNSVASSLLPTSVSPNLMQYIFSAREYIFSRDMMNSMESGQNFINYFKQKDIHFLSQPWSNKLLGIDDYRYYKQRVKTSIDIQEGLLKIKVQAKNPRDAKHFADALLKYAELWVNSLSDRMYKDKINEAEKSLYKTEHKLQLARKRMLNYQVSRQDLNPKETVAALYSNLNDIKSKIKQAEREIAVYKRAHVNSSPVVERLRAHLSVLKQQHKSLNLRLVDKGELSMNKILSGFESALIERDFAEKEWEVALKTLENIKIDVFNQKQYFLTIVPPISSPLPVEPNPLKIFIMIFIVLYSVAFIVSLIKTSLKISMKRYGNAN